jgi:FMN phosphatase YigB (HAD superfamily)
MISTLLIDLDDTLLINDMDEFIPAYLNKLSQYLDPILPSNTMIRQLYVGTQAMINNNDLDKTLAEVFAENFFPFLEVSAEELISHIDSFYAEEFRKLKKYTQPIPSAQRLIAFAMDKQYEIVIATNPLFPLTAIEQRLEWAELPADQYPFSLITSYESFHFAKPKMEYVAEILAKCGRNPHEAVMIGNDLALDLPPATELGAAAFHVGENSRGPYPYGNLDDAIQWIKDSPAFPEPARCTSPEALLARLRGNLVAFIEFPNLVQPDQWRLKPSPDNWAPIEVLAHLRDVEKEINLHRVERILKENTPFLSAPDSDRWAEERSYIHASPDDVYADLIQTRRQTLALLESQASDAWERPTRHAIFGPTQLSEIVRIFLEHDVLHIRQIRETLAALEAIRS